MSTRPVEVEVVHYKTPEMVHAARELIKQFAIYSGIVNTDSEGQIWPKVVVTLAQIIQDEADVSCLWKTSAVDVLFSGFPNPAPRIQDGKVVFRAREPRFVMEEKESDDIRPSLRTHVQRVLFALAQEMKEVYRLDVTHDPLTLTFSRQRYAERIEITHAVLLENMPQNS